MTYYTVPKVTTTFYEVVVMSVLTTWKKLGDAPARTWKKLQELGISTWKDLKDGIVPVITYYCVDKPTTTFYEVE